MGILQAADSVRDSQTPPLPPLLPRRQPSHPTLQTNHQPTDLPPRHLHLPNLPPPPLRHIPHLHNNNLPHALPPIRLGPHPRYPRHSPRRHSIPAANMDDVQIAGGGEFEYSDDVHTDAGKLCVGWEFGG